MGAVFESGPLGASLPLWVVHRSFRSGPNRHSYIGPTANGPKYPGPSSRKLCTKGPRDRGVCILGRNQGSEGLSGAVCEFPCRLRYLCALSVCSMSAPTANEEKPSEKIKAWLVPSFNTPVLLSLFMDSLAINLVDAEKLDAVAALFEAQLREHKITTPRDDLRMVIWTVIADQRHGFMLEASAPDGSPIAVAYASSLLSLEHGGVSGWLEEPYVLPRWRGRGIGSRLVGEVIAHARELGWRALDLEVEASHQRAISLYVRHQFQPHSRSRFFRIL